MAELPAGISVGTGIVEGATQLTIDAAAASAVAAGEVGAGVAIAGLATGYVAGTLAWKLGGTLGDTLPCLDCGDATPGTVNHGCPAYPGVITNVIAGNQIRCSTTYDGEIAFNSSPYATYVSVDRICSGVYFGWTSGVIDGPTRFGVYAGQCAAGTHWDGIRLHFSDGTSSDYNATPNDVTNPGTTAAPKGTPVQIVSTQECTNTSSGAISSDSATSASFLATDRYHPAIPVPGCASGSTRTKFGADVVPLTANQTKKVPLIIGHAMPISTAAPADHMDYSQCLPGGASYPCQLRLKRILSDGSVRDYDPNVDPNPGSEDATTQGRDFKCLWGLLSLVVSECRPVFGEIPTPRPPGTTNSSNCDGSGFSFNPVSWVIVPLKCLFIPTSDFNQWSQFKTNAQSRPPLSVVTGASGYVNDFFSGYSNTSTHACPTVPILGGNRTICFDPIANASQVATTNTSYQKILTFIRYGLWVGFAFYAYKRITKSFGSKEIEGASE